MAKFIAVHTLPTVTEENVKGMIEQVTKAIPNGFTWVQTYGDFANHKFFCEWEAPSKDALEQSLKAMNAPFEAVYPVKLYNVAKKKFV
jgi:hypothetical protein